MQTIDELDKELKQDNLKSLYLFYGEETFLLENAVNKIKKKFGEIIKGINYINIDDTNINELIADIETPAFGYEKKLIIVKNSGLFKREVKKKGTAFINQKEQIIDYIKNNVNLIESAICLIFIEEDADKSDKLTKLIDENGVVCNFERQKPVQIAKKLKQITNAYKVNVDENTLMYLIECVGLNMQDLINEIRKLIEYCGEGGRITKELIDILTIKQIESVIFRGI